MTVSIKKDYDVRLVNRKEIRAFIEKWHYSGTINGVKGTYCFGLYDTTNQVGWWNLDNLVGAMIYGKLGMANAWRKYAEDESEVLELRRLCCIDDTPKNTESYFIGKTLRILKNINPELKCIVSYADTNYNHEGTIYKASNFEYKGKTSKGKVIVAKDGSVYHDRAIRTTYDVTGELKPFAIRLLKELEDGEAQYKVTKPKNIYVYDLRNKKYTYKLRAKKKMNRC